MEDEKFVNERVEIAENGKVRIEKEMDEEEIPRFKAGITARGVYLHHDSLDGGLFIPHKKLQEVAEEAKRFERLQESGELVEMYNPSEEEIEYLNERLDEIWKLNKEHLTEEEIIESLDINTLKMDEEITLG